LRKLIVFNQVSLDGYFVDAHGDMSWAHNVDKDEQWDAFVAAIEFCISNVTLSISRVDQRLEYKPRVGLESAASDV
jgi:hypothetical protein